MIKHNKALAIFQFKEEIKSELINFFSNNLAIIINDINLIDDFIKQNSTKIIDKKIFLQGKDYAHELLPYKNIKARIEPGAIIREGAIIEDNAIILMNATINTGAHIGSNTMIDMGTVIGSNAQIGRNCHIGANAVIAGVLEPPSKSPVVIEDNCFIGANSVVLEGVRIGHDSIIGALTLVNKDVPPNSIVYGIPGKIHKSLHAKEKCKLNEELR